MTLDHLAHLRSDSDRFRSLLYGIEPTRPVPSCPDWDANDLLWHLAEVQWFWGTIVSQRLQDDDEAEAQKPPRPGHHDGLLAFFDESTALLQTALAETDPSLRVWMWDDDNSVGYIRRRQAHEALIHRLDAELTAGEVTPLDTELASDGVDEIFTKMFSGVPDWGTFTDAEQTVAVAATDTGLAIPLRLGRWAGTSPNTGTSYDEDACLIDRSPGFTPQATVRGTASALDAWAWGRADASALTTTGDDAVVAALQALIDQGVQ